MGTLGVLAALLTCSIADFGDIGRSRRDVLEALVHHGLPQPQIEAVALIASELMTNAISYGVPPFVLNVSTSSEVLEGLVVTVTMTDHGVRRPSRRDPRQSRRSGGYGLNLVEATSSAWGVRAAGEGAKEVWAVVTARSAKSQNGSESGRSNSG